MRAPEPFWGTATKRRRPAPRGSAAANGRRHLWVDTAGSAEIVTDFLVIARTGHARRPPTKNAWTSATIGVCEALLTGVRPTVSATTEATGYAKGTCTKALRHLSDLGLLTAGARRGRKAGRAVADPAHLLEAYVVEAHRAQPALRMSVSALWRDPLEGAIRAGRTWEDAGTAWAATGLLAAAAVAPLVTTVGTAEVYVDADSVAELENLARAIDLRPIEGGRLVLAPFPTRPAKRLTTIENGLRVVPWPRLVADLRRSGVRGEDAAEHVREKMQRD
jgi:hypothetical protein